MNSATKTKSSSSYDKESEVSDDGSASTSTETSSQTEDGIDQEYQKRKAMELAKIQGIAEEYIKEHHGNQYT